MMSQPRYVFVFLEIFAQEGGIQSYIQDVLRAYSVLLEEGKVLPAEVFLLRDEVKLTNPFGGDLLTFHYYKRKSNWQGRLNLSLSLFNHLLWHRPKHLFCGHIKLAPLISLFCKLLGIPYTVITYGKEVWSPLPSLERKALQQSECIWTISRYSRDQLCSANGIKPADVQILPCGVDGEKFRPGDKSPLLLSKYDLETSKVILTVARLWSGDIYKGVDVTIRALPEILKVFRDVKYLVIGRGDDTPRLRQLAKDLGVGNQVIFAGFIPTEELVAHYRLADLYSMPSLEGFGIVYLEAMACGCPVLAGDADGSADPLQDGRLGWRVPYRNSQLVSQACLEILNGQDKRCNSLWLREQVLLHFSQQALKTSLEKILT